MNGNSSYQILDTATRTRYRNQRETMKLRDTINDLSEKQHLAVYQHTIDQKDLKYKLNKFRYGCGQRDLYKCLAKGSRENSATSFISRSDTSEERSEASINNPSLLLHDLNALIEFEKSFIQQNTSNKNKKLNFYDKFCRQYGSKLQKPVNMSLKDCCERMKTDIKTAIARSARNYHTVARRNERIY